MKSKIEAVKAFHEAFQIGYQSAPVAKLTTQKLQLRFDLMDEENSCSAQLSESHPLTSLLSPEGEGEQRFLVAGPNSSRRLS